MASAERKQTYSDINSLSVSRLNASCRQFNVECNLPKKAKVNAVCHCLNISTTGDSTPETISVLQRTTESLNPSQLIELQRLTPKLLYCLNDWSSELRELPSIDETEVKRFLLQTDTLTAEFERTYKLSRPYKLKQFVHSVQFCNVSSSFCVIRARCLASQSTDKDDIKLMHIILDKITGQPYGGYCTCTVGYCQSCGHIGAALFCLSDWIASGFSDSPNQLSCTDVLCKWNDPKGANIKPITMMEMKQRKSKLRKTRADYVQPEPAPLNPDAVCILRSKLLNATTGCEVPAAHALSSARFTLATEQVKSIELVTELPEFADFLSPHLAYCMEVEANNNPLPIAFLPHRLFDASTCAGFDDEKQRFIQSVSYSAAERIVITKITEGQNRNLEWYNQRMGSVTASNTASVLRFMSTDQRKPEVLLRRIQGYNHRGRTTVPNTRVSSLNWGMKCEPVGLKCYNSFATQNHKDLKITTTGLHVSPTEQFIRASPDGLVSCSCHPEQWLLEIKCPWTARDIDPVDAVNAGIIKYVSNTDNAYSLIRNDPFGYYEQVQSTLAVTGLKHCDFVIWTLRGFLVLPIEFDSDFWEQSKFKLQAFFENFVVTEILTERVWRALPFVEYSEHINEPNYSEESSSPSMSSTDNYEHDDISPDDLLNDETVKGALNSHCNNSLVSESVNWDYYSSNMLQPVLFDIDDFEIQEIV